MTITVNGPNGVTVNFPDGTDQPTIAKVMQQATGAKAPAPAGDPLGGFMHMLGIPAGQQAAAMLRGGADSALLGFPDEGAAALAVKPFDGDIGGQFNSNLDRVRGEQKAAQAANPAAYLGGQVGGGVATMAIPGAGVARGAGLLRTAADAATAGGVLGGVYGFGSDNGDLASRTHSGVIGAGVGAVAGGAVPFVGRTFGAGVRNVASAFSGVDRRAANLAARAASDDALPTGQAVQAGLDNLGGPSMPADLGPNLQRQAGAIAATPGPGQAIVRDALLARSQGANARIQGDLNTTLGPAPVPSAVDAGIVANQRALGPQYDALFAGPNVRAVDTSRLALNLEAQTVNVRGPQQRAAQTVRRMLDVHGTDQLDPNPRTLFETRNAIDGMVATEQDPKALGFLERTRQQVDGLLATAVPGIKDIDAQYAELARQRDAVTRGQQVLDSGRTAPRPAELADEVANGAVPQGTAVGPSAVPLRLQQGARAEIDRIIGTTGNDVTALQGVIKGDGSWNRDRLATLFGQDRADQIIHVLDREKAFADTTKVVTGNSETAARTAAQGEIAPSAPAGQAGVVRSLLNMKAGDAAARVSDLIAGGVTGSRRTAANEALARLLTTRTASGQPNVAVMEVADALARRQRASGVENAANLILTPAARSLVPLIHDATARR